MLGRPRRPWRSQEGGQAQAQGQGASPTSPPKHSQEPASRGRSAAANGHAGAPDRSARRTRFRRGRRLRRREAARRTARALRRAARRPEACGRRASVVARTSSSRPKCVAISFPGWQHPERDAEQRLLAQARRAARRAQSRAHDRPRGLPGTLRAVSARRRLRAAFRPAGGHRRARHFGRAVSQRRTGCRRTAASCASTWAAEHSVDVLPQGGRLVAFLSDRFEHEVLPARRERMSFTGWFRRRPLEGFV